MLGFSYTILTQETRNCSQEINKDTLAEEPIEEPKQWLKFSVIQIASVFNTNNVFSKGHPQVDILRPRGLIILI